METINPDTTLENADWPKRTPDTLKALKSETESQEENTSEGDTQEE